MSAEQLARRHQDDPLVYGRYLEAFKRSDFEAILNYPRPPYLETVSPVVKVEAPVLSFHELGDTALLQDMLNRTWEWLAKDLTLVTIPDAGHWALVERADFVTRMMRVWLQVQGGE